MGERREFDPGHEPSATLTADAYGRLGAELDDLVGEGRTKMAERLLRARELGDIRENAEYDAAKNEQGLMEARIRELQRLLDNPKVVEAPAAMEEAAPGILVVVRPLDEDEPDDETYLLAASKEERVTGARTVSIDSPFGKALLGKRPGDKLSYEAPGGSFSYEVLRLEPRP